MSYYKFYEFILVFSFINLIVYILQKHIFTIILNHNLLSIYIKISICSQVDSEDLVDSVEWVVCHNNNLHKKSRSIQPNIMNLSVVIKKPPLKKSEKPSEEKHLNNIPIKEVIQINSKEFLTLMKS